MTRRIEKQISLGEAITRVLLDLAFFAGAGVVTHGLYLAWAPLAFVFAGAFLMWVCWMMRP